MAPQCRFLRLLGCCGNARRLRRGRRLRSGFFRWRRDVQGGPAGLELLELRGLEVDCDGVLFFTNGDSFQGYFHMPPDPNCKQLNHDNHII